MRMPTALTKGSAHAQGRKSCLKDTQGNHWSQADSGLDLLQCDNDLDDNLGKARSATAVAGPARGRLRIFVDFSPARPYPTGETVVQL